MKKNNLVLLFSLLIAPIIALTAACQGGENQKQSEPVSQQTAAVAEELPAGKCGPLVLETCEKCHYLTRACQNLDNKKKRHWKRTVKTMAEYSARKGLIISKDNQDTIIECLSSKDPEITTLCAEYR